MTVSEELIKKIDSHWALLAVGSDEKKRAQEIIHTRLVKNAVGNQISIEFEAKPSDDELLQRVSLAYEMAAIEGLDALINPASGKDNLRNQCIAGASGAFEIRSQLPLVGTPENKILNILLISSLAYCGDRWSDLRRWYSENETVVLNVPSVANVEWDKRILYRLFDCWIRLFRKKRWDDLDQIREIISGLREDQKTFESKSLDGRSNYKDQEMALRLIALYHWAKATEILAIYMLQGEPANVATLLDKHFESSIESAIAGVDPSLEVLLRWLHASARQMVSVSLWWVARAVNSRVTRFVKEVTKQQSMFELLPPQKAALQEQGLLDQAATAIVVELPTSGGKTLLAQFRILQALNQFDLEKGWVAYVAPTKALTAQITRRLRKDFEPIGVRVEQLTGAVEIDAFEEDLLSKPSEVRAFDVLVATPEKLQLVIRNKKVPRPLALIVMDEAHNLEDETRGLRIELLLATIKRDYASANFLLLMPYVEKAETLARWLAQDTNAGKTISLGTTPWKPNERIVGFYTVDKDDSVRGGWQLKYETLITTPKTIHLKGQHKVGGVKPLNVSRSKISSLTLQTAGMAKVLSGKGTSIAVARTQRDVWVMARQLSHDMPMLSNLSEDIIIVQNFLKTEISEDYELVGMLSKGIGVHHAGISEEVRTLMEWLAETGKLKVLCATSTIAQGINFPVSSVFLSSRSIPHKNYSRDMTPRDFWNLAGRAGRINQDSVGVVGLAGGLDNTKIIEFVSRQTGALVSRFVNLLDEIDTQGKLNNLDAVIQQPQWDDFRCYIAHLWREKNNLDAVLSDTEQLLRNTYGYGLLKDVENGKLKAEKLLEATKNYARKLAAKPGIAELADMTGFSPEGVTKAMKGLNQLERKLDISQLRPESLFGDSSNSMADLYGVMLKIPQLADSLGEFGLKGDEHKYIADITKAWVSGKSIQEIAREFFSDGNGDETKSIGDACKAIYRSLANVGTWGLSALCRMSGIDFDALSDGERRQINMLPAMIYHGVNTEEAVLMRMNNTPRTISQKLGEMYNSKLANEASGDIRGAKDFLRTLSVDQWDSAKPKYAKLSGEEYRKIWQILSGNMQ